MCDVCVCFSLFDAHIALFPCFQSDEIIDMSLVEMQQLLSTYRGLLHISDNVIQRGDVDEEARERLIEWDMEYQDSNYSHDYDDLSHLLE